MRRVGWVLVALCCALLGSWSIAREEWWHAAFMYFVALSLVIGNDRD